MAKAPDKEIVIQGKVDVLPSSVFPMDLINNALATGNIEIIREFVRLQHEWKADQAREAFDAAMAEAAKEFPIIAKNSQVGFESARGGARTSYKYVDLADIVSAVSPILGKHGLYHRFEVATEPNKITVTCVIAHRLGHSIRNAWTAAADTSGNKNAIQAMGSTQTYLSRYTLMASLGLAAAVDDDGSAHKDAPQPKPDVMMRKPDEGDRRSSPGRSSGEPAGGGDSTDRQMPVAVPNAAMGTPSPGASAGHTITEVAAIESAAREAARKGSGAFREFWLNLNQVWEQNVVKGLQTELVKLRDDADKAIAQGADPLTGEIH